MFARIDQGHIAELFDVMPELEYGQCAIIVEVAEGAQVGWRWTPESCVPDPSATILAQIAALEALQTPRLLREAFLNKDCVVSKPGCCIDGMTPVAAVAHLDAQLDALRAQLAAPVYYQKPGE